MDCLLSVFGLVIVAVVLDPVSVICQNVKSLTVLVTDGCPQTKDLP